jgi:tRNA pseudouridine38-40 synthase
MKAFRSLIAYDGSGFHGWQLQPGCRTVQGVLAAALERIFRKPVPLVGASRTDAGVHAVGQVASFQVDTPLDGQVIGRAWNALLPEDVCVRSVEEVPLSFDACRHAIRKRYRYLIVDAPQGNPFLRLYCWQWRRGRLDVAAMAEAAQQLLGTHDFACFQNAGSPRQDTVRTLYRFHVKRNLIPEGAKDGPGQGRGGALEPSGFGDLGSATATKGEFGEAFPFFDLLSREDTIVIEVEGSAFLYNMVRAIVGSLVEVGRGARPAQWIGEVLSRRDRRLAGPTAPPQGLYLMEVVYPQDLQHG